MFSKGYFRLAIVVCIFHICVSYTGLCPPPEDAFPCWCNDRDSELTLYCSNLHESAQVYKGLHKLANYKITKLMFWRCMIEDLAPNVFQGLNIENVEFQLSLIPYNPPQFLGLEKSLTYLDMSRTFTRNYTMKKWSLGHLQNLKYLTIEYNIIPEIDSDWIESSAPNLWMLTLDNNNIEKLGDRVFAKLETVTSIYMNNNKISELKRSMFPRPAEKLRSIVANDNIIETLPTDMFDDMELQSIQLNNNQLVTLDETTWGKTMDKVSIIYLTGNPFVCDSSLKWLTSRKEFPFRFKAKCDSPKKLKGKSLAKLNARDLD